MKQWALPLALLVFGISLSGVAKEMTLDDLFPTDRVLDIQIFVEQRDWDLIRHQSRDFRSALDESRKYGHIKGPYTYVPARVVIDDVLFSAVGLRKKGFIGSQSHTRPSLKIKLDYIDKEASVEGLNLLTLNNNKQDLSQMDQYLGYALFNKAGAPAPRCAFARVSVNGEQLGVYSHVESIRAPFLARQFGDDSGVLYEGTVVDFFEGWENAFEYKRGDDELGRERIKQLIAALSDPGTTAESIGELVDLDSFYRFWALEGLVGFGDGYTGNINNFYVYLNPKTDKFHFIIWGADALFRKYSHVERGRDRRAPISVKMKGRTALSLYRLEEGRGGFRRAMMELLENHWDEEKLLAEIDRVAEMIEPHLAREQRQSRNEIGRQASFEREVEDVRRFIRLRRDDIMEEIRDGMPIWNARLEEPFVMRSDERRFPELPKEGVWHEARMGKLAAVEKRLADGADVNERDKMFYLAPLGWAALYGQTEVARALLDNGADVNILDRSGNTPLHTAAFLGDVETAKLLIENGANIRAKNHEGGMPIESTKAPFEVTSFIGSIFQIKIDHRRFAAIEKGRAEIVKLLNSP
ncbi:MAG: CotH kinase family protein [Candidatus Poribacteria bacterium]|nr:CotH kinase family protein [Candidatus Poribacteria bacterium]